MSYSSSPHLLSEKLRDELDQQVIKWAKFLSPSQDSHMELLLWEIVRSAKLLLHRDSKGDILQYIDSDNAKELCEEHPELRDVLRAALKEKKFSHIVDQSESFH